MFKGVTCLSVCFLAFVFGQKKAGLLFLKFVLWALQVVLVWFRFWVLEGIWFHDGFWEERGGLQRFFQRLGQSSKATF